MSQPMSQSTFSSASKFSLPLGSAPKPFAWWQSFPGAWLLALGLMAGTTFGLLALQRYVMAQEPHTYIRPYIGLYILPVIVMTLIGGRLLGLVTLALSAFISLYYLLPPAGWQVAHRSDWVGMATFVIMGLFLTMSVDALQTKAALIAAAAAARQDNTRLILETKEAQARLQSVLEAAQEQRLVKMLPPLWLPELPAQIDGLDLSVHYEVMLDAGSRSAPLFDCFAVREGTVALVVGSLDGLGVEVGSGVALVRHMLRSALYRGASPAEAAEELNALWITHCLLPVPCRLFISVYEASSRTLTSVACGPVLAVIRRIGGGQTEELATLSPHIGERNSVVFHEQSRSLFPGDVLLLLESENVQSPETLCWKETWEAQFTGRPTQEAKQILHRLVGTCRENPPHWKTNDVCLLTAIVQ